MCERSLTLRALVNARLTAAAEEIFALVERTIAEYEEELCRSKEENQKKQQLLDSVLSPQVRLHHTTEGGAGKPHVKSEPQELSIEPEILYFPVKVKEDTPDAASPQQEPIEDESEAASGDWTQPWEPPADSELSNEPEPRLSPAEVLFFPVTVKDDAPENALPQQEPIEEEHEAASGDWTQPWEPPVDANDEESHGQNQSRASDANQKGSSFYKITKMGSQDGHSVIVDGGISMTELKTQLHKQNCPICGKSLKRDLWSHMLVHTGERPFSCSVCNKGFTRRSSLTLHMGLHLSEKPFQCSICKKGFTQKSHLKFHMDSHTKQEQKRDESVTRKLRRRPKKAVAATAAVEVKPDANAEVGAQNPAQVQSSPQPTGRESKARKCRAGSERTELSSLRPLAKFSFSERGDECPVCGKFFHDLWKHMLLHTGERPFRCKVCRKGFTRMSSLTLHKALHMNEKPFKCSVCDRGFTQNNNLKVHMAKHAKEEELLRQRPNPEADEMLSVYLQQYLQSHQSCEPQPSTSVQ